MSISLTDLNFRSKSFSNSPVKDIYPGKKSVEINFKYLRPLHQSLFFPIKEYKNISRSISPLDFSCCPSTILFTVVSVTINSINSCIRFSKRINMIFIGLFHISFKFQEGFPKTFDALSTVRSIINIIASTFYRAKLSIKPIKFLQISRSYCFWASHIFIPKLDDRFASSHPISAAKLIYNF